jgi:hypothetical protein
LYGERGATDRENCREAKEEKKNFGFHKNGFSKFAQK